MCHSSDGLHFNCVSLVKGVVQNTRGVNHLPGNVSSIGSNKPLPNRIIKTRMLVVSVTNIERLSGESIGLNLHIGTSNFVHETGFTNIGVTTKNEGTAGGVNAGKTSKMLSHLLQVCQTGCQLSDQSTHATLSM